MLVNKQLYGVPLRVPRTFYVNSSLAPEDPVAQALGRRVTRLLPYGQQPLNIYQVCMPVPLFHKCCALLPCGHEPPGARLGKHKHSVNYDFATA